MCLTAVFDRKKEKRKTPASNDTEEEEGTGLRLKPKRWASDTFKCYSRATHQWKWFSSIVMLAWARLRCSDDKCESRSVLKLRPTSLMMTALSAISSPFSSTKGSCPFAERNFILWSTFYNKKTKKIIISIQFFFQFFGCHFRNWMDGRTDGRGTGTRRFQSATAWKIDQKEENNHFRLEQGSLTLQETKK